VNASTAVATPSRTRRVVGWVLRVVLALAFLGAGATKLAGDPSMVTLFDDIGAGQWMRFFVGTCEVAGAVGLLVPRLYRLAALCLVLLMLGATIVNVAVIDANPTGSLVLGILTAVLLAISGRPQRSGSMRHGSAR
jgi:putative oxidoreductase